MKANNGGQGMTDEQVARFIDRYIPGYIFFGDGVVRGYGTGKEGIRVGSEKFGRPPWSGRGLRVTLDEKREVLDSQLF